MTLTEIITQAAGGFLFSAAVVAGFAVGGAIAILTIAFTIKLIKQMNR